MAKSIPQEQLDELQEIRKAIDDGFKALLAALKPPVPDPNLPLILAAIEAQTAVVQELVDDLTPEPTRTTTAAIAFGGNMAATPGTLAVGATLQASFVGVAADGTVNTTTKLTTPPTWSSDNTAVATVDATTGLVTGVGAGTANITGTAGSFTDSDGTVVGPLNASNSVSDTAPVIRTVSAQVNFA
jgi:hypothetical protein